MTLDEKWFTEISEESGSAFSLKINQKLHEEKTPYQTIAIYQTEQFGNLMVIDGFTMVSTRDNFLYHEMMAHPVLFTHPDPKKVAIIGGGDCGTLREVLKHPEIEKAWQIEIDQRVTELSRQYFPELCESNDDPRAELCFVDGIQWMADAAPGSIDIIIIDSTDPIGPAEGLFTEAFYQDCKRVLSADGILIQQSESPLIHLDILRNMYQSMRATGFSQLATLHFPQCIYPSGWWSATMASASGSLGNFREQDVINKTFDTTYYNADIHRAALAVPEFFKAIVKE